MKSIAPGIPARIVLALALLAAAVPPAAAYERVQSEITVFASVSLGDVLTEIDDAFRKETGISVRYSFAASSTLARQIESGAPADVFIPADVEWMDYLEQRARIDAASRRTVAGNALVLIAPGTSSVELRIAPGFGLAAALGGGRLATGDPVSVPAGRYARAALTKLGVWHQVADRLVPSDNVRAALAYVSRGEAPLGIVYRTDARLDPKVRIVDTFPAETHPPIVYSAAATGRGLDMVTRYLDFLSGETARTLFEKHGFTVPRRTGSGIDPQQEVEQAVDEADIAGQRIVPFAIECRRREFVSRVLDRRNAGIQLLASEQR
jgi:molybdate transport system substrate-binding protein